MQTHETSGQYLCYLADPHLWAAEDMIAATAAQLICLSADPNATLYLTSVACS